MSQIAFSMTGEGLHVIPVILIERCHRHYVLQHVPSHEYSALK